MDKQAKCNNCKENAVIIEQGQFYACATCWLKVNTKKIVRGKRHEHTK